LLELEQGRITPDKVRQIVMSGIADSGATRLILPEQVVRQLGLPGTGQCSVRYADDHRVTREMVRNAHVQLLNRGSVFSAVVEPGRTDALLGAIVMEELDLLIDCIGQRLIPRDPNTIISEVG